YLVVDGKAKILDVKHELCAGCGVCVEACPYNVIRLVGPQEGAPAAKAVVGAHH
ncbi:MAG: 4Fe-4S binding protein, partial [Methanocorpusculum sp.]|nr:4Fe-4S binding protein [Methanocorpusculum sp.]MDD3912942.1 4Fe-4S binding protein [Methanocorpusculum sp.]